MTTALARPGTYITETLLPGRVTTGPQSPPVAFVQEAFRGPTTFTRITSWTEYTKYFGAFEGSDSFLPYSVFSFFQNGGREAYIARVVGANGAVAAAPVLQDRNTAVTTNAPAGAAQDILLVEALNIGVWGNDLTLSVADGTDEGLFTLLIKFQGTGDAATVERWIDLSTDPSHPRFVESVVNGNSTYIKATVDVNNDTAEPNNIPAVQSDTPFVGGLDGNTPTAAEQLATVEQLDAIEQPVILVVPGEFTASNVNGIISYAQGRDDIFYIADVPPAQSPSAVITYADSLTRNSHAAIYYPWVKMPDPNSTARGATKLVPPSGMVAGQYVTTDLTRGVFKTPAGVGNLLSGVVDVEVKPTADQLGNLNLAGVNAIRVLTGRGIAVYGGRTLRKTNEVDRYIGPRRTLIYLKRASRELLEFAHFENNDSRLRSRVTTDLTKFLKDLWQAGGLAGGSANEAFYVLCDESNNTDITIEQGILNVEIGVALQYPAEFVVVTLTQIRAGGTTTGDNI